jgi:hypothetical protein
VSTLEALVAQMSGHARPGDLVCAIIGAGRGAVHAWTAVVGDGSIASCGEPVTATIQDVAVALGAIDQTVERRVIIGGEIDAHQARIFVASMPGAVVLPPAATQRRAAWLAVVMRQAIAPLSREVIEGWFPEEIQPIYLLTPTGARPASLGWRLP